MYNPFEGIQPNLGPFAGVLSGPIQVLLALVWAVAFVVAAVHLIASIVSIAKARKSHRPDESEEQIGRLGWPVAAVIGLAIVPTVFVVLAGGLQG